MRNLPNIEKSGFHRGQYVGYGGGDVWRISRSNSSYGNWIARPQRTVPCSPVNGIDFIFAMTLQSMSMKLEQLKTANAA